jgi:DNA polymerase I-like protein with 3'-5' exonuclease and polymerase domains
VGTVEIVSLCFDKAIQQATGQGVFLVEFHSGGDANLRAERIRAVKTLLESPNVVKAIHDCRTDCDALHHLHDIHLTNVHDTACYHAAITRITDSNLNDVLQENGIPHNVNRDKSVYQRNLSYWATRPMTLQMKTWASSDVDKLLMLAKRQVQALSHNPAGLAAAKAASTAYTTVVAHMHVARNVPLRKDPGRFIGPRGSNVRSLQARTNTILYRDHEFAGQTATSWLVFYPNEPALAAVKRAMGH